MTVISTEPNLAVLSITLRIVNPESVGPIAYCAGGANIPISLWSSAPQGKVEERENPEFLRYHLHSMIGHGGAAKALDRFKMFGNFLVWHLHSTHAIPSSEANRLLTLWDGKHVT